MKIKKELNLYPFYDLEGLAEHFQKMAVRGWFIKKANGLMLTYELGSAEKRTYALSYGGEASVYQPDGKNKAPSFKNHAIENGWDPVYTSPKLQIYTSSQDHPGDFRVNPYDRIEGIHQASKPVLFLYGTMIVLGIFSLLLMLFKFRTQPINLLSGSLGFLAPLILGLLSIYSAAEIISYMLWKNRADVAATRREFEKTPDSCRKAFPYILGAAAVILLFSLLTSGGNPIIKTFILSFAILMSIILSIGSLRNSALEKGKPKLIMLLNLLLGLVVVAGLILSMNSMAKADAGIKGDVPVKAQEIGLGGEDILDYSRSSASFLLRHTESAQARQTEDGSYDPVLSYEITDSRLMKVDGWVLNYYLRRMDQAFLIDEAGEKIHPNHYEPIEPSIWSAQKAWQAYQDGEASNVYLLLYDGRLVEIGSTSPLSNQQIRSIGEKFHR